MTQYDPIAIKSGILTVLGTDTLRDDRIAVAGLDTTTNVLVSGDVCQVDSTALRMKKAVNTSTSPIVGIYDGETNSVVRKGIVVATMKAGVTLANGDTVWLSSTAGALTNVKPTADMLHELGVVVDAATRRVLLQQKPVIALLTTPPSSMWICNYDSNTVSRLALATGTKTADYPLPLAYKICYDGVDGIWVITGAAGDDGVVYKLSKLTGAVLLTLPVSAWSPTAWATAICTDGVAIYAASYKSSPDDGRLCKYLLDGTFQWSVTISPANNIIYPFVLAYDPARDAVWISGYWTTTAYCHRVSDGQRIFDGPPGAMSRCNDGRYIAYGQRLFVVEDREYGDAGRVRRMYCPTGATQASGYGAMGHQYGATWDDERLNYWVSHAAPAGWYGLLKFDYTNFEATRIALPYEALYSNPRGCCYDGLGYIWVANGPQHNGFRLNVLTEERTPFTCGNNSQYMCRDDKLMHLT